MRFNRDVSEKESLAWYVEYVGRANFLPWRGHGAATVFIYSVSSKQPPGRPGPISITVLLTTNEESWMNLDLLDFNQLDFGKQVDDLPTLRDES